MTRLPLSTAKTNVVQCDQIFLPFSPEASNVLTSQSRILGQPRLVLLNGEGASACVAEFRVDPPAIQSVLKVEVTVDEDHHPKLRW